MIRFFSFAILISLLMGCNSTPSKEQIQTAIAETQSASVVVLENGNNTPNTSW